MDATFRIRPDDRDVLLERATELGVIRDDQQARRTGRGGDRLGEDVGRGRTPARIVGLKPDLQPNYTARIAFKEPR